MQLDREKRELAKYRLIPEPWSVFFERFRSAPNPAELWEYTTGLKRRRRDKMASVTGTSEEVWARRERHGFALASTGDGSEPDTCGTKLGGYPELGAAPWPTHERTPLQFLAQLDLDELAALAPPGWSALPEAGLLSFFGNPLSGACTVLHQTDRSAFVLDTRAGFSECVRLFPRPRFFLPSLADPSFFAHLTTDQRDALNTVYWESGFSQEDEHPVHSAHANSACVNGYPFFGEGNVPADEVVLLEAFDVGELGRVRFTIHGEALMRHDWSNVRMTLGRTPPPDWIHLHAALRRVGEARFLEVWKTLDPSLPEGILGDGSERAVIERAVHRAFGEPAGEALFRELLVHFEGGVR